MLVKTFEQQVKETPNNCAVKTSQKSFTYDELNQYANRIAYIIKKRWPAYSNNDTVALLFDHSADMIAALFSVLKAGKVYVPLDPDYPLQRLSFMISHSEATLVLTGSSHITLAKKLGEKNHIPVLNIEEIEGAVPRENHERKVKGDKLAYILYTSGSTGKPKGVMQTHENVLYFINRYKKNLSISENDCMTLLSSFSHDAAVMDIYGALLNGAALYPWDIKREAHRSSISRWLKKEKITIWHSVPTVYRYFVNGIKPGETFPGVRLIVLGGEEVLAYDIEMCRTFFPQAALCNLYGQSESSYNAAQLITPGTVIDEITLGEVVEGTQLFVVDEYGSEVIALETGEIVIASPHISPGYWKDEQAAKNVFTHDPELGKLYRTGDLGRLLLDGTIEFVARKDLQVKIRGIRVEPLEIESQLLKYKGIEEAVVIAAGDKTADKHLAAYISSKEKIKAVELHHYLQEFLPAYMVPSFFLQVDRLPLTPSGKIDRNALPAPGLEDMAKNRVLPRNELDKKLVEIWSEVLDIEKDHISIDANFFQLGGHSLKAMLVIARVHKELAVKVPLEKMFKKPFIRSLSLYIQEAKQDKFTPIEIVEKKEFYDLSYNQRRLWIIYQLQPGVASFTLPGHIMLKHKIDENLLKQVLNKIVQRYESLRTSFGMVNDKIVQFVKNEAVLPLEKIDISSLDEKEQQREREHIYTKVATTPFDLTEAPLFRLLLVKLAANHYELLFNMHHIISDRWSMELLKKEFFALYNRLNSQEGLESEPVEYQYKDFAAWYNKQINDPELKMKSHQFWQEKLNEGVPVLELPRIFAGNRDHPEGASYKCMMSEDLKTRIKNLALNQNITSFIVMFSAYLLLLSYFSGEKQVVCSVISAGREHVSLQNIVGFFVNSVIFKTRVHHEERFSDLLKRVNSEVIETFQHQGYPLEVVFNEFKMKYPDIPFSFNMLNIKEEAISEELNPFEAYHLEKAQDVKFDIESYLIEYRNGINMHWLYKKAYYKPEFIEHMSGELIKLIDFVTKNNEENFKAFKHMGKKRKFIKNKKHQGEMRT